ncbi:hypothetical protein O7602_01150 [Micromonospora sp. WMMD1128]|uniref:hypothetical protein n=1 Tax=unclassified Micromonospora TaxID=2617518 RepID=UPI00248B3A84|nr:MULTISPECIES: hypothetical protein [unclassified Micromonospora]WBB74202.1 hypothetical protein O7602_01150 [Micromonospora sp. WMMD1128]WFE32411.1 hypothetical protein O7613_22955 [Micromonospora sp. WMMD975]
MTTDDERTDDFAPTGERIADRLDLGDAEQAAADQPAEEESRQPVDEPRRLLPPYDRAHKRRNQRPLPT